MSSFVTPLVVSPLPDGRRWRLFFQFKYDIGYEGSDNSITVPAGFEHDFASIPKFIFWILPWYAKFNKASVLHDWLYRVKKIQGRPITRKEADRIWYEAMIVEFRKKQHGKLIADIEYYTVRLFGWLAWRNNQ